METNRRYNHFYIRDDGGHPVSLVSWVDTGNVILYAFATWRPSDKFSREDAHSTADRRLSSIVTSFVHKRYHPGSYLSDSQTNGVGPGDAIIKDLAIRGRSDVPTRLKTLVRRRIKEQV